MFTLNPVVTLWKDTNTALSRYDKLSTPEFYYFMESILWVLLLHRNVVPYIAFLEDQKIVDDMQIIFVLC